MNMSLIFAHPSQTSVEAAARGMDLADPSPSRAAKERNSLLEHSILKAGDRLTYSEGGGEENDELSQ